MQVGFAAKGKQSPLMTVLSVSSFMIAECINILQPDLFDSILRGFNPLLSHTRPQDRFSREPFQRENHIALSERRSLQPKGHDGSVIPNHRKWSYHAPIQVKKEFTHPNLWKWSNGLLEDYSLQSLAALIMQHRQEKASTPGHVEKCNGLPWRRYELLQLLCEYDITVALLQ
ncbi:hypothetical protein J6590_027446 [Homalodisca vitripennis]|nr:hypothetical protein J6590_027446 [Homalodisca vitripennis]